MWLQRLTMYLLKHRWQAVAVTFLSTFIPVVGVVGILIAALVTLCKSIVEGAFFTLVATLPYLISFYTTGSLGRAEAGFSFLLWAAIGIAVLSNVLTWVFAVMLRKQNSLGLIMQVAALTGVLVISVVHLFYPNIADWWAVQLQSYFEHAPATVLGVLKAPRTVLSESQIEIVNISKQYATGFIVVAVLFNAMLQLLIARWWQVVIFDSGNLRKELRSIRLSPLAGVLFAVSLLLSYLGNSVVLDIIPVLYMLFCAAGLSLLHYAFALANASRWFWLTLFYLIFIWLFPLSVVFVSMLALFDIWLDFRKRFRKI